MRGAACPPPVAPRLLLEIKNEAIQKTDTPPARPFRKHVEEGEMTVETKEEAIALLEQTRAEFLQDARQAALRLGKKQINVTIDDVRAVCPPPAGIDPRVMGAVFKSHLWKPVGHVASARAKCHRRPVALFRLIRGSA